MKNFFERATDFLSTDYYLISYPKCGRTWLRSIMGEYFKLLYNIGEEHKSYDLANLSTLNTKIPRIESTHINSAWKYSPEDFSYPFKLKLKSKIFMCRDPKDTIVSLYYHRVYRNEDYKGNISDFVRMENGGIRTMLNFYEKCLENSSNQHLISYEKLRTNPEDELVKLFKFIKVPVKPELMTRAIENCSFANMKKKQKNKENEGDAVMGSKNEGENSQKVRKGKIGGFTDDLSKEDIDYINNELKKYALTAERYL